MVAVRMRYEDAIQIFRRMAQPMHPCFDLSSAFSSIKGVSSPIPQVRKEFKPIFFISLKYNPAVTFVTLLMISREPEHLDTLFYSLKAFGEYSRFDVYLVSLDPTIGSEIKKTRPCIIISPNEMNRNISTIIAYCVSNT